MPPIAGLSPSPALPVSPRVLAAVFLLLSPAGRPPTAAPTNIKVQVNEVIVPVTVTDDRGRFVEDLEAKDFHVFDQGKEQRIEFFSRDRNQPVVVGFLLDMSNNTRLHWKTFQEAAMELVWNLLPGDKKYSGYLITYSNDAELQVNTTTDSDKIADKIRKIKPGGGAALFDAIYMACTTRELVKGEPYEPRRVIIVIGDGHDNASKKSLEEVIEIAQRNLVTVYGMSTVAYGFNTEGEANLKRLAEETGGRVEYPLQSLYKDVSGYLSTPVRRRQLCLQGGHGRVCGRGGEGHLQRGGQHRRRGHHAVHPALCAGHQARVATRSSSVRSGWRWTCPT